LEDFLAEEGDLEAVLAETISKSKADSELWVAKYEAMNALRKMNKFHVDFLQ
jgi:hypothetical protein